MRINTALRWMLLSVLIFCMLAGSAYAEPNVKLTDEQIRLLKENLQIPEDMEVTDYSVGTPSYWEGAGLWTMQVELYSYGKLLGSAGVDPNTMELMGIRCQVP